MRAPHPPAQVGHDDAALSPEQRAAVEAPFGPALVIAGPGSGKTRVVTHRVAHLLARGVAAERILMCTFTNRAAQELCLRVAALSGSATAASLTAGTFHHLAHRALERHGARLGLPDEIALLDRADAEALWSASLAELAPPPPGSRHPRPRALAQLYSQSVNGQLRLRDLLTARHANVAGALEATCDRYAARKAAMGALDFDDLLFFWKLLYTEHPAAAAADAARFTHVIVDEYQDASRLEAEVLDLLCAPHRNLMVVGDAAQAIYGFRGAGGDPLASFPQRYPEARVYPLATDYRSTPEIVALARAALPTSAGTLATLHAARRPGVKPALVPLLDGAMEARFVAARVRERERAGVPLGEMAVLYRNHAHSLQLQLELARDGLPFSVRSGARFFAQPHVKDVLAALRLLANPRDDLSRARLRRRGLPAAAPGEYPAVFIGSVLETLDPASAEAEDLRALREQALATPSLTQLLAQLALASDPGDAPSRLTLSTIHQAKGLEWRAVFVIGLADGRFPSRAASSDDLDEERRLFFVALTRARDELYLCHPRLDAGVPVAPSRFLTALPPALLDRWAVTGPATPPQA